jgi:hypothetical protein
LDDEAGNTRRALIYLKKRALKMRWMTRQATPAGPSSLVKGDDVSFLSVDGVHLTWLKRTPLVIHRPVGRSLVGGPQTTKVEKVDALYTSARPEDAKAGGSLQANTRPTYHKARQSITSKSKSRSIFVRACDWSMLSALAYARNTLPYFVIVSTNQVPALVRVFNLKLVHAPIPVRMLGVKDLPARCRTRRCSRTR